MSHESIRCVVMLHKGVWSEAYCARNEDVGQDLCRDIGQF